MLQATTTVYNFKKKNRQLISFINIFSQDFVKEKKVKRERNLDHHLLL